MTIDLEELLNNAVISIQIGIEDFLNQDDHRRTLSAVRNLYAGVLLLFKYRIATAVPNNGHLLIQNVTVVPVALPNGTGFTWEATPKQTTIDLAGIQQRCKEFNISSDWGVIQKLQVERNAMEHAHSQNAPQVSAKFVSDLFPVLRHFIEQELRMSPIQLLGAECWDGMLQHHEFFQATVDQCAKAWLSVRMPESIKPIIPVMTCAMCSSVLLMPIGVQGSIIDWDFEFSCVKCGHEAEVGLILEDAVLQWAGGYSMRDARDGVETPVAQCPGCEHETFVHSIGKCVWCEQGLEYSECRVCFTDLTLSDQDLDGYCGYHSYQFAKDRD